MQHKTIKQTLTCDLTDKERREYGISLATTLADYDSLETEKKQNADHYKDRLAGLQARADALARKVRDGKEWRDVECRVYYGQPDREHKQTVRLDTMEVVKTERMTGVDLQLVMPLEEDREEQDERSDDFDGVTVDVDGDGEDSLGAAVEDFHGKVNGLPAPEDEEEDEDPEYDPAEFGDLSEDTLKDDMVAFLRFKSSKTRLEWFRAYADRVFDDVPAIFVRYCLLHGPRLQITAAIQADLEKGLARLDTAEPMPTENGGIEPSEDY